MCLRVPVCGCACVNVCALYVCELIFSLYSPVFSPRRGGYRREDVERSESSKLAARAM